jgi:hypothetical protein
LIIYLATNNINGKRYIGQTIRPLSERWKDHCRVKDKNYFHNAIRKYGKENFTLEIIDTANSTKELDNKEIYWINKLNTLFPHGYNLKQGGSVSMRGRKGINNPKTKLIYQFCLDGGMVDGYYGTPEAAKKTKISESSIYRNLKDGTPLAGGYVWIYASEFDDDPQIVARRIDCYIGKKHRSVVCVETGERFWSMTDAARKYNTYPNSISACCSGRLKTTGGYHWRYCDRGVENGDSSFNNSKRR